MFGFYASLAGAALRAAIKNPDKRAKFRDAALQLFQALRAVYFDDPDFQ